MTTRRALGTLLVLAACGGEQEEDISADAVPATDLPTAVTRALSAKYRNATFRIIEDVITTEGGSSRLAYYEVLLETEDKRFVEVQIDPTGILKEERKASVTA